MGRLSREAGFDANPWIAIGPSEALDEQIAEYAAEYGAAVLTRDLDFGHLLASKGLERPSVVQIRADSAIPEVLGARLIEILATVMVDLEAGALITIDVSRTRVRVLPIQRQ